MLLILRNAIGSIQSESSLSKSIWIEWELHKKFYKDPIHLSGSCAGNHIASKVAVLQDHEGLLKTKQTQWIF